MDNHLLVLTPSAGEFLEELRGYELPDLDIYPCEESDHARTVIQDCNLILGRPDLVAPALKDARRLDWVQSTWAGVEPFCKPGLRRDYLLTGVKGVFSASISEFVFAYLLGLERSVFGVHQYQLHKEWLRLPYRNLEGLVMGLAGLGSIGESLARTARHFGMRTLAYKRTPGESPYVERIYCGDELPQFLRQLDFLVLCLPATPQTQGWLDFQKLKQLKPSVVLFNIGRGSTLVEIDLVRALQDDLIRAAVLDVFEVEPLPLESPLWNLPNAFISPHNSAYSFPKDIVRIFAENYRLYLAGQPLQYVIDFERGY
jgi:phosphoglycerate dehydrogenase-like enzyme